jgi:hypothetical protein
MDGDDLLVSTMADRAKAKAVQRDPHVSLCVLDEHWPLTYLQVYGRAVLDPDPEAGSQLMRKVVELMSGEPVPDDKYPAIQKMCAEEKRVVLRVTPYATFETPPRHVYKADDIDGLTHFTSTSQDW